MESRKMTKVVLTLGVLVLCSTARSQATEWPQFRGLGTASVANNQDLPTTFSAQENIAWKAPLPGKGLSSPIVVGNRVVVTSSSGKSEDRLHVLCFAVENGKKLWERQFWATGRTMCHPKTNVAAPTPASDGKRIFAFYSSCDLVALDLEGNVLWVRGLTYDHPNASNSLGMASSPVVVGETLVVPVENDSESFALGINVATGANRWEMARPAAANWTSPLVLAGKSATEHLVVLQGSKGLTAVEPLTGTVRWTFDGGCSTIPSTGLAEDGLLVTPSHGLTALRPEPKGDPKIIWQSNRVRPGTASPVVYKDRAYAIDNAGVLKAVQLTDGAVAWQLRLKGPFSSTPVIIDGRLYCFNEAGLGQVVALGATEGKLVGSGNLGEAILCCPAVAHHALYVRSDGHLWKIAKTSALVQVAPRTR